MADSMIPVPYARQRPYDNDAYVQAMSELMMRNSERQQQLMMARGQNSQQMWQGLGNLTMATMAQIGNQHDEQQKLKALQAERDRDYLLKQEEMKQRLLDHQEEVAYRQRQEARQQGLDRNKFAEEATSQLQVGDFRTPEQYASDQISGTPSAAAYRPQAYEAARLPASPVMDEGGFSSYVPPATPSGTGATPAPAAGGTPEDYMLPYRRSMSPDTEERPQGFVRQASQSELLQLKTLQRQAEAAQALADDRKDDNARAAEAAKAKAIYDAKYLELMGRRAAAAEKNAGQGGVPQIVEANGKFYRVGKGPGGAVEEVMAPGGGKPLTKYPDTGNLGDFQNVVAYAIGKTSPTKQPAVMATVDRMLREETDPNHPELLGYLKKQVLDNISGAERQTVQGRAESIAALKQAQGVLQQLQKAGVDTGLVTGKTEDFLRWLGTTGDQRLVDLGTMLSNSLASYRHGLTGAAFGKEEGADYAYQWPSYRDEFPVNMGKIQGLLNSMSTNDSLFWNSNLGPSYGKLFGATNAAPAPSGKPVVTKDMIPPVKK